MWRPSVSTWVTKSGCGTEQQLVRATTASRREMMPYGGRLPLWSLLRCTTTSRRTIAAVPAPNIPKTMSMGPNQKTAPAPAAHPIMGHRKMLRKGSLLCSVNRS